MTPTSPLAGLLTGLLDGTIVVLAVLLVAFVLGHRSRPARVAVRVDEAPDEAADTTPPVELRRRAA